MPRALKLPVPQSARAAGPASAEPAAVASSWAESPRAVAQRKRLDETFGRVAQAKVLLQGGARRYQPALVPSAIYQEQYAALDAIAPEVTVEEGDTGSAEGLYRPAAEGGAITIPKPRYGDDEPRQRDTEFNANVGTLTHEMQHALDDLRRQVKFRIQKVNVLHTEWRAWAMQAAVTLEHQRAGRPVTFGDSRMLRCFRNHATLAEPEGSFFKKTAWYLNGEGVIPKPSAEQVLGFMREHEAWLNEALEMFRGHVAGGADTLDWGAL